MKIINASDNYIYIYEDGKVVKKEFVKQKGIVTSFITPKVFFSLTKKFDKTLFKEDMIIEMEKYIFSYPNIDVNKEYKIVYLFIERENKTILEALIAENDDLVNKFKKILNVYKYIDFISPSFLAWEEYYNLTKTPQKNDVFIYFDENEAYLSVFSEGKYLFHKSLNKFSDLSKITGKKTDDLIKILSEKGLDRSKYDDEELFLKIDKFFSEFFLKIFNQLNYSVNEYEIAKYERIFFYSPFKINYLFEQYMNYWELNGIEFKPTFLQTEYNHLEYLITVFNAKNYSNEEIDFSIFKRPPLLITTPAGKFISFTVIVFLLFVSFFVYCMYDIKKLNNEISFLNQKYFMLKRRSNKNLVVLKILKMKLGLLKKKYNALNSTLNEINKKANILYDKNKKPLVYNLFAKITFYLQKYNLKVKDFKKTNNHYSLEIVSKFDNTHEIAKFMQDLINEKFKNVTSKTIKINKNKYISYVEFENE